MWKKIGRIALWVLGGFAFERAGLYGIGWGGAAVAVLALIVSITVSPPSLIASWIGVTSSVALA